MPNLIPFVETQLMFNETTQNNYKIPYDEFYTKNRVISDVLVRHDTGSTQQVNSHKYLFSADQTKERTSAPDKKTTVLHSTMSIFEKIMLN